MRHNRSEHSARSPSGWMQYKPSSRFNQARCAFERGPPFLFFSSQALFFEEDHVISTTFFHFLTNNFEPCFMTIFKNAGEYEKTGNLSRIFTTLFISVTIWCLTTMYRLLSGRQTVRLPFPKPYASFWAKLFHRAEISLKHLWVCQWGNSICCQPNHFTRV